MTLDLIALGLAFGSGLIAGRMIWRPKYRGLDVSHLRRK